MPEVEAPPHESLNKAFLAVHNDWGILAVFKRGIYEKNWLTQWKQKN